MQPSAYAFAIVNDLFDEDLDPDLFFDDEEAEALLAAPAAERDDGPDRLIQ